MAFYGDDDIPSMLRDLGVPVVAGSVSSYGLLNKQDKIITEDGDRGQVHVTVPSVIVQVSAFPESAIDIDAAVTADGVNYVVRDHDVVTEDGALLKLWLRKA